MPHPRQSLLDRLKPLIGLRCLKADIGLSCTLRISFEIPATSTEIDPPEVQTFDSAWRIVKDSAVLAGRSDCVDWEQGIESALAEVTGQRLVAIDIPPWGPADVRFTFGSAPVTVEYLEISEQDTAWTACLPDGSLIGIDAGGAWKKEAGSRLSDYEHLVADHAEAFWRRSEKKVPPPAVSDRCDACAYWRHLTGGLNFSDLGVCTNGGSPFDGRLVALNSGCQAFRDKLGPLPSGEAERH